jgi:hypothetical protein
MATLPDPSLYRRRPQRPYRPDREPIIETNPFLWDGSDIGYVSDANIRAIGDVSAFNEQYWWLTKGNFGVACTLTRAATCLANIIDEIKPLFGLPKLGTHRCRREDSHYYTLTYVEVNTTNNIVERLPLSMITIPTTDLLQCYVRRTLAFREVIGLKSSNESNLLVRNDGAPADRVFSAGEISIIYHDHNAVVPESVKKRWFPELDRGCAVNQEILLMANVADLTQLSERVLLLRSGIEYVIDRIDKHCIWIINTIMARFWNRCASALHVLHPDDADS